MQFYFIRHAQSENNAMWLKTGTEDNRVPDPDITDLGRQQVQRLAKFLQRSAPDATASNGDLQNRNGFGITHLYCSLMRRAVATGAAIAQALDVPLHALEDIHEWGGIFEIDPDSGERRGLPGAGREFFSQHYPDLVLPDTMEETGWWNRPYEPDDARSVRARRFIRDLLDKHGDSDDRVAVVSHGGFYEGVMSALFNLPPASDHLGLPLAVSFGLNNTAITRIDFVGETVRLAYANRVDFLPETLIS